MRADMNDYPELDEAQVLMGGGGGGMGGQSTADFEIYGYDFNVTDRIAAELQSKLMKVEGIREVLIWIWWFFTMRSLLNHSSSASFL